MEVTRYGLKKLALSPRTAYRRRKAGDLEPLAKQLLESSLYSDAMYEFIDAVAAKPDLLTDVPVGPGGVAIDLGAYIGEWAKNVAEKTGATVYGFEANAGTAKKAMARTAELPSVTIFPYGVGGADARERMARDGPGSSIHKSDGAFGTIDVEIRDIATVLADLGLDHVDVLKVNIEGAEYELFDRLAVTGWLDRIDTISVQFHEWGPHGHAGRKRNRAQFARTHDEEWCYPWVWELWTRR